MAAPSLKTMNTIETLILDLIGENTDSPDVFLNTDEGLIQIRDSINDAIEEISMITGMNTKDFFLPLKADTIFYRLQWESGTFGWIMDAWLHNMKRRLNQTDIIKLSNSSYLWMKDTSSPTEYMQIGLDIVGFHPVTSSDSDMVRFRCVYIPGRYETEYDRIFIVDNHKWAVVHYVVSEYWASRGDARTAVYHFNQYLERVGFLETFPYQRGLERQDYNKTEKDTPRGLVQ